MEANPAPPASTSAWRNRLTSPEGLGWLLLLLALTIYWPDLGHEFITFDDPLYFSNNAHVKAGLGWDGIVWAFTNVDSANWHPLTWLSLMLDSELGGADPGMPHFTNLALHALDSVLLFLFLRRATGAKWRSALVAGLFVVHPLNVESVAWLPERKNTLCLFFFLLCLLAYVRYVEETGHSGPRRQRFYAASLGAFALALLSKPMVVTGPFVLLLLDGWPLSRSDTRTGRSPAFSLKNLKILDKLPFFGLSLAFCVVTYLTQKQDEAVNATGVYALDGRLVNALVSYGRYLGKTIWPVDLAIFYPRPSHWPAAPIALGVIVLVLGSVVALWWLRKYPYVFMGWCWFLGTLMPSIGLVQVGRQAMADRYAYLPLIGLFIIAVWGGFALLQRARVPASVMFLLSALTLSAGGIVARHQVNYWQNDGTLFGHAVAVTQNNVQAEVSYGKWLETVGQPAAAEQQYQAAVVVDPEDYQSHFDLANTMVKLEQFDSALHEFQESLRCKPDFYPTHYNLGLLLQRLGHREAAVKEYQTTLRLEPDWNPARVQLGILGVTAP